MALNAVAAELGIGTQSIADANDALAKAILAFAEQINAGDEIIERLKKRIEAHEKSSKQEMQRGNVGTSLSNDADALRVDSKAAEIKGINQEARRLRNAARGTEGAAGRTLGFGPGMRDGIAIGGNTSMSVVASTITPIHDGMVSANGKPMYSQAATVTPIHDGSIQMAKSDPKDVALFAKTGGPFDTLFNGIFNRIDALYEAYQEPIPQSNVLPLEDTSAVDVIKHQWDIATSKDTPSRPPVSQPMELRVSGSLELQSGGQSVDIMSMLRDNPLFIREISRLLTSQLSNAQNGGRGSLPLGIGNV